MPERTFTIGEAARRAGVSADTVRYYERRGVLPAAVRTANGYRRYADASVQRILFVRNTLRVGFTLRQIAAFLRARESGRPPCRDVRAAAGRLVEDMDQRIAEMVSSRAAIVATLAEWDQRLALTPAGTPARLLDTFAPSTKSDVRRLKSVGLMETRNPRPFRDNRVR
jgi:MerR family copper efflux transcriptional regulator